MHLVQLVMEVVTLSFVACEILHLHFDIKYDLFYGGYILNVFLARLL